MPAVHLPFLAASVIVPACIFLVAGFCCFVSRIAVPRHVRKLDVLSDDCEHRACTYCGKGVSTLIEQRVRYEGMEIVQTQLFACSRCGLPHWVVTRSPQEWRAVR